MEREDLYYVKQHDVDAAFLSIVSGGGAHRFSSPSGTDGFPLAAAPRTSTTYVCDNCGRTQIMFEPVRYAPWCDNKKWGCNGKVMKKKGAA